MHWYTLVPDDELTLYPSHSFPQTPGSLEQGLLPNGHAIVTAIRELLQEPAHITLRGPFLCYEETLYFPRPLHYQGDQPLIPLVWLPEQDSVLWDRRKPVPLGCQYPTESLDQRFCHPENDPQFLPYESILHLLTRPTLSPNEWYHPTAVPQPWRTNIKTQVGASSRLPVGSQPRLHSTELGQQLEQRTQTEGSGEGLELRLNPGWKFAIGLDDNTHYKLKRLGTAFRLHLYDAGHPFCLQAHDAPLKQQWQEVQDQSQRNWQRAEQALAKQTQSPSSKEEQDSRILAYLITPGVFERKHMGVATCRAFPWEWYLAHAIDQNQTQGALVSVATAPPIPMVCRSLSKASNESQITSFQVLGVPAGSVYYLEYPVSLFQDQPFLKDGRLNKVHIWRKLGYSEFLWVPYTSEQM